MHAAWVAYIEHHNPGREANELRTFDGPDSIDCLEVVPI
jgi:hypothetical protein